MKLKLVPFALSLALFAPAVLTQDIDKLQLPDMGDSSGALLSPQEEREFGSAFFRNLHSEAEINQDSEIQQYRSSVDHAQR
jgi:beta-barrel assembly-enhancing protease